MKVIKHQNTVKEVPAVVYVLKIHTLRVLHIKAEIKSVSDHLMDKNTRALSANQLDSRTNNHPDRKNYFTLLTDKSFGMGEFDPFFGVLPQILSEYIPFLNHRCFFCF